MSSMEKIAARCGSSVKRPRSIPLALGALILAMIAAAGASRFAAVDESPPLTNQDIVRMVASGMPAERILARIRGSPGAFDVSSDMIEELTLAGVPETILDAMRAKARGAAREGGSKESKGPGGTPPAAEARPAAKGWIEIDFLDDPALTAAQNSVAAPAVAADADANTPKNVELAFVVTCSYPVHVPDFWDRLSPLGESPGRHQILFFQPATAPFAGSRKERAFVFLPHPPSWRFEAGAAEHRGIIGVAARLGADGGFALIAAAPYDGLVVEEGLLTRVDVSLRARFSGKKAGADPEHPVAAHPGMTNIGSTAAQSRGLSSTVKVVKVHAPAPPPAAEGAGPAPPPQGP